MPLAAPAAGRDHRSPSVQLRLRQAELQERAATYQDQAAALHRLHIRHLAGDQGPDAESLPALRYFRHHRGGPSPPATPSPLVKSAIQLPYGRSAWRDCDHQLAGVLAGEQL
jgi:hypothetical protein